MATLDIRDLHVSVNEDGTDGGKEDPLWGRPDRAGRRDARGHGAQRVGQVDPVPRDRWAPGTRY